MALTFLRRRRSAPDAEMTFIDHLEALRGHIFRSVIAVVIGAIIAGIYNKFLVKKVLLGPTHDSFPTYGAVCGLGRKLNLGDALCMSGIDLQIQSTQVTGQFSMFITVVLVAGVIIAFPYIFYEFWKFISPALTKKELQRTRGVIFWVSFLFFVGISFGYFIVSPYSINFFANFQLDEIIENRWTINSYIDMMLPMVLGSGLAFQLPLVMYFLAQIGVVSSLYLTKVRKYAVVIIFLIAAIITPGPDVISQIAVAAPLLLLYEISIILTRRVAKRRAEEDAKEWS